MQECMVYMITTKSQFSRGLLELTLSSCRLFGLPDIPAQRIPAAAQELISCISAGSGRPKDQRAAAPGTGRGALEALLQMINVLQVCSARLRQHLCFDGRLYPLHLSLGEEHLPLALDVSDVAASQDVWRHFGSQTAIAPKYDDGMHPLRRDFGQV